jgi:dTDP-4-dehydrorhamnose reductase
LACLLVTGASGYLGRRVALRGAARGDVGRLQAGYSRSLDRVVAGEPLKVSLDSGSKLEVVIREAAPTAIIHTAAINPGGDPARMGEVNRDGSRRVAEIAREIGARLVHVSSDVVHDGTGAPYGDADPPSARRGYGRSKAEAEDAVLRAHPGAVVVRTSLIYGLEEIDRGTEGFADRLAAGEPVRLFRDELRQPIWVENLAEALLGLALDHPDFAGCLNVVGDQVLSRDEYGRRMLGWWGVEGRERVESILARDLAPPPLDLRMENGEAKRILGIDLPGVDAVLQIGRNAQR